MGACLWVLCHLDSVPRPLMVASWIKITFEGARSGHRAHRRLRRRVLRSLERAARLARLAKRLRRCEVSLDLVELLSRDFDLRVAQLRDLERILLLRATGLVVPAVREAGDDPDDEADQDDLRQDAPEVSEERPTAHPIMEPHRDLPLVCCAGQSMRVRVVRATDSVTSSRARNPLTS